MEEQAKQQARLTKELNDLKESMTALEATTALAAVYIAESETKDEEFRERFGIRSPAERATAQYDRLINVGFTPTEAEEITAIIDAASLQRMELRYEAAHEGKLNSPDYCRRACL